MPHTVEVKVPPCYSTKLLVDKNIVRQMLLPGYAKLDAASNPPVLVYQDGTVVPLLAKRTELPERERALLVGAAGLRDPIAALSEPENLRWVGDLAIYPADEVRESWLNKLSFTLGDPTAGRPGLRLPQLGALHAVLSFWTTGSTEPATVVMPTGTGKTETMVALLVAERPQRLLVVVPSDVLRTQIASKFESFGVLQQYGVVAPSALRPVVGRIAHAFSCVDAAREFAERCNVIVTTPTALFASEPHVRKVLLEMCSHLFVDEAHHVEAKTWSRIRDAFEGKPIVQFTATPYREDGKRLAGRIIYTFPLRQAQQQKYFSRINYISVTDFGNLDRAIASRAIAKLREDCAAGLDHLLMARAMRIGRAREIYEIYKELAPEFSPVLLHSSMPVKERRAALDSIACRASRVIVCVDMLGEGFDLPSLKIAAIHDPHKSLGITLQFIGRFARVAEGNIGEATVVTGRPEGEYDERLHQLYREDPDWNEIIQNLSDSAIGQEREIGEFESAFAVKPESVSIRNIFPKMSCVVFRTQCSDWRPQAVYELFSDDALQTLVTRPIAINEQYHVAWFVVQTRSPVPWGDLETIADIQYDLYILYWDQSRNLLYINSSNTGSVHEELAKAVCGPDSKLISGETVYRVMAHVKRLVPTNVGLLDVRNRSRRFSMHVGADVLEAFPTAEARTKTKTNIFAYGYENGMRVSIGGSLKGRVWSYRVAPTIKHWVDWCDSVGAKLTDANISVDEVMRGFIRPISLDERPSLIPLALEWPWELLGHVTEEIRVDRAGSDWPLIDTDLVVSQFSKEGPISFKVCTPDWQSEYRVEIRSGSMYFQAAGPEVEVVTRRSRVPLSEFLDEHGLIILFEKDAVVTPPAVLLKPDQDLPPFELDKLVVLDWTGVDIRKESQGPSREADSIQARMIEYVLSQADWDIVIDDDGSGEVADIVAMRIEGQQLVVELVHCKYSSEDTPGSRVADLYEVCGQAQKATKWRHNVEALFRTLIRREKRRQANARTGFILGDGTTLYRLRDQARFLRPVFGMTIAQPGVSKRAVSPEQLQLLASTEVYLQEVAQASLRVVCSE